VLTRDKKIAIHLTVMVSTNVGHAISIIFGAQPSIVQYRASVSSDLKALYKSVIIIIIIIITSASIVLILVMTLLQPSTNDYIRQQSFCVGYVCACVLHNFIHRER